MPADSRRAGTAATFDVESGFRPSEVEPGSSDGRFLGVWVSAEPPYDVVNITNSMLIGLARPLRETLRRPVLCTLQGEDLFLEGLVDPHKTRALTLIRSAVADVDRFVAVSSYYASFMSKYLHIPASRIAVVPLGINVRGFEKRESSRLPGSSTATGAWMGWSTTPASPATS